ncbi:hypothetical protein AAGG74_17970 [Bacillus mexicanus]|uniref:hypothetical protein n=1 Tax=Bacillus mexicanus TaxID=2834415 RepID=UPI003D19F217
MNKLNSAYLDGKKVIKDAVKKEGKYDYDLAENILNSLRDPHNECDIDKVGNIMREQQEEIQRLKEKITLLESKSIITISTPFGNIEAKKSCDPNYPGINIDINGPEGIQNAALVEFDEGNIKIHNWKQEEEDAVYSYQWNEDSETK